MPGQNEFLRALSRKVFDQIKPRLIKRRFVAGDVLFRKGDAIASVTFLDSGAVSLVTELSNGARIESAMVGRDGVLSGHAVLGQEEATYTAIAEISGEGQTLDLRIAREMARNSEEFLRAIALHEHAILAQAQQSAACNAVHNLTERLARWLLRAHDVAGSDSLALTQEFIAEMLGVGRTSVSLVAHQLQQGGLISYKRGLIAIKDEEALRESACECYAAVKAHYAQLLQSRRHDGL